MKGIISGALIAVAILAGCVESGGDYVGKWINVKSEKRILNIKENGDSFIIEETAPSPMTGEPHTKNIPATLKDGMLEVKGFGSVNYVIDKTTGNLIGEHGEYKKVN